MSYHSNNNQSYKNSRFNRHSKWPSNSSNKCNSSRTHYSDPRSSYPRYGGSSDFGSCYSNGSSWSNRGPSYKDRPFTVRKPPEKSFTIVKPEEKSFTIVKPEEKSFAIESDEPCDFTIVTSQDNDFDSFTDSSRMLPERRTIYSRLSLKQSNYFIFGSKTSSDVLKMSFLYAVARMIYEDETDETMIPAIAAAEFASDYLPDNRRLFGSQADGYFERVMAKAIRDPNFVAKVRPTEALYSTLADFGLSHIYPFYKPEPLHGEQYMRILQILSTSLDPAYANCDLVVALTAVAPCLQLDYVTQAFLRRLQSTVLEELRIEITLEIKSTNIFFEQYLKEASEREIEEMLVYWRLAIPDTAKKLKSLLKRLPGNGLLPIVLVGRALTLCDDFPWDRTVELYRKDWKALHEAMLLINNDPYYGYCRDKDEIVHPRHYPNVAWLGRQLCIAKLEDNYPNFNLWVEKPDHVEEIQKLIEIYVGNSQ